MLYIDIIYKNYISNVVATHQATHPQFLMVMSFITKPSSGSSPPLPVPSTRTHLLTNDSFLFLESC